MDEWEIAHRRLHNQHLAGPPLPDPVAVVRHFGAVQAQEFAIAKWSIGQRTQGFDDPAVQAAIDGGAILRTHVMRPTWHFVAAADIRWIQALTAPRVQLFNAYYNRMHGLDEDATARSNAAIAAALRGGNHLTRKELAAALATAGIEATGNKLAYVVMRAELEALIANGPVRGRQHTYALVEERAPQAVTMSPDAALAELTRRYFTSHGPATVKDFTWWSSLTATQVKRGLDLLGRELVSERVGELTYWYAPSAPPARDPAPTAHVLQAYDEYGVAYTESRRILKIGARDLTRPDENTLVHSIIVDSQTVGVWRRLTDRSGIVAEVTLSIPATAAQRRAVQAAFSRYQSFAGVPVTLEWSAPRRPQS